jgi:hypothetical protein
VQPDIHLITISYLAGFYDLMLIIEKPANSGVSNNENKLIKLLDNAESYYHHGKAEDVVIRCDSSLWCENQAKLVNREFIQVIEDYWRNRIIE